jgi:hypothetical protein
VVIHGIVAWLDAYSIGGELQTHVLLPWHCMQLEWQLGL